MFRNAPAPDSCAAHAHGSARQWPSPSRARVSSVACSTRRRNLAALAHSCRFLLSVISAFSRRPRNYYVDARLISNGRGQVRNMLARMLVDDGASLGGRERSTALCGKGRCLHVQSRSEDRDFFGTIESVQSRCCYCPHEYLYVYRT